MSGVGWVASQAARPAPVTSASQFAGTTVRLNAGTVLRSPRMATVTAGAPVQPFISPRPAAVVRQVQRQASVPVSAPAPAPVIYRAAPTLLQSVSREADSNGAKRVSQQRTSLIKSVSQMQYSTESLQKRERAPAATVAYRRSETVPILRSIAAAPVVPKQVVQQPQAQPVRMFVEAPEEAEVVPEKAPPVDQFTYGESLYMWADDIKSVKTSSLEEAATEAITMPECIGFRRDRDSGWTFFARAKTGKAIVNGFNFIDWYDRK